MRQRKDPFGIAYSYCGLGNVERMAGRFKKALPFYRKAEKLYGTIGDRVSYAYTLWSLGTTYKMLAGSLLNEIENRQPAMPISHLKFLKRKLAGQYTQAHWAFY